MKTYRNINPSTLSASVLLALAIGCGGAPVHEMPLVVASSPGEPASEPDATVRPARMITQADLNVDDGNGRKEEPREGTPEHAQLMRELTDISLGSMKLRGSCKIVDGKVHCSSCEEWAKKFASEPDHLALSPLDGPSHPTWADAGL